MSGYSTHHQAWKCWKNVLSSRFRSATGFYVSYGFAFLLYTLSSIVLPHKDLLGGANTVSKNFEVALKSKIHFQKSKKVRIFYSNFVSEFWILKPPQNFSTQWLLPQISFCKVIRYLDSVYSKKAKPYDAWKPVAPLKREPNAFYQHFQAWWWVEYPDIFRLLKVDFKAT